VFLGATAADDSPTRGVDVRSILDEALDSAARVEQPILFARLAHSYARAGHDAGALRAATTIPEPTEDRRRVAEYRAEHDLDRAIADARTMKSEHDRGILYEAIARRHAELGNVNRALDVANDAPNNRYRAHALLAIVRTVARRGELQRALTIARDIRVRYGRAHAYTVIALAAVRSGDGTVAERGWREAVESARKWPTRDIKGGSPQASALEEIVLAQFQAGAVDRAAETVQRIQRGFFRAETFITLATAHAALGDRLRSEAALQRAVETGVGLRERDDYRTLALERIVAATVALKSPDAAGPLLDLFHVAGFRINALVAVAGGYARRNDPAADALFSEALALARAQTQENQFRHWNVRKVLQGQIDAQRFDDALATADALEPRYRAEARALVERLRALARTPIADLVDKPFSAQGHEQWIIRRLIAVGDPGAVRAAAALVASMPPGFFRVSDIAGDRFSTRVLRLSRLHNQARAAHYVGRAWAKHGEAGEALAWARTQPLGEVRSRALLGVAEGIIGIELDAW
jgi:hypothetical protein